MSQSTPQDLLQQIQDQLMTQQQRQAYRDKLKAESYLRWLAFYYLGRREHSKHELRQKLLDKQCDPDAIDALLIEFADEGYQSDERMTSALIKDGITKKHGLIRIYQSLKKHHLTTITSANAINTWIDEHADFFSDLAAHDSEDGDADAKPRLPQMPTYEVDWLTQAVEARVKKYGDSLPTEPKEKMRQLRFLQYRGFGTDVCFDALKHNLTTLAQR